MADQGLKPALNHMTAPRLGFRELCALATRLGCVGVELRNDLAGRELFDGVAPAEAGAVIAESGLRLLALAEVKRFNQWSTDVAAGARALIGIGAAAGAEAVSLIPSNDGTGCLNGERQANLRVALRELRPMLEDKGLVGLVEPLGFATCSLRFKEEVANAIEALGAAGRFRIIHDTFHHFIAGETQVFPAYTGMVHVSGVETAAIGAGEMRDHHRVLVGPADRLGSGAQLRTLADGGYRGSVSVESFAPEIQALADPLGPLRQTFAFLGLNSTAVAA